MSRRCRKRRVMAEMNVVPYIDVMLVLLVIFMVTAPMLQTGVQINLPEANTETLESNGTQAPVTISIDASGVITLEDGEKTYDEISTAEITNQIMGKLGDNNMRPVYIRADSNIAYRIIMAVMAATQQAGAKKIGLIANTETE